MPGIAIGITGATGFIGRALLEEAPAGTVAVVRRPEAVPAGFATRKADLSDVDALTTAFAGLTVVVANAALAPGRAKANRADFDAANVTGTENLVAAAARAGVRRIVLMSSISVLPTPVFRPMTTRDARINPDGWQVDLNRLTTRADYARTKARAEIVAEAGCQRAGIELVMLRPGPVLGPRDPKFTQRVVHWATHGPRWVPTARLPAVTAADVAKATFAAAERPGLGGRNYLLAGPGTSLFDLVCAMRDALGATTRIFPIPIPVGVAVDTSETVRDLGVTVVDPATLPPEVLASWGHA